MDENSPTLSKLFLAFMDILLGFLILLVGVSAKIILRRAALRTLSEEIRPRVTAIMNTHFRFDFYSRTSELYPTLLVTAVLIGTWVSGPSVCETQGAIFSLVTMLIFFFTGGLRYLHFTHLLKKERIEAIPNCTQIFLISIIVGALCDSVALLFQFSC